MNLWKSRPSYSTRVRVEYLYFRRILLKNSANNSIFAWVFDSILDSRSSNSTLIFQFCDLASTRPRLQSFDICRDDEPRVRTPLRWYLVPIEILVQISSRLVVWDWSSELKCFLTQTFWLCFFSDHHFLPQALHEIEVLKTSNKVQILQSVYYWAKLHPQKVANSLKNTCHQILQYFILLLLLRYTLY